MGERALFCTSELSSAAHTFPATSQSPGELTTCRDRSSHMSFHFGKFPANFPQFSHKIIHKYGKIAKHMANLFFCFFTSKEF